MSVQNISVNVKCMIFEGKWTDPFEKLFTEYADSQDPDQAAYSHSLITDPRSLIKFFCCPLTKLLDTAKHTVLILKNGRLIPYHTSYILNKSISGSIVYN